MRAAWMWIAALSLLALATFFASDFVYWAFTFTDDLQGWARGHDLWGRVIHVLMIAWLLVFIGMCIRHRWKALWCLPLTALLYLAQIRWAFSFYA